MKVIQVSGEGNFKCPFCGQAYEDDSEDNRWFIEVIIHCECCEKKFKVYREFSYTAKEINGK